MKRITCTFLIAGTLLCLLTPVTTEAQERSTITYRADNPAKRLANGLFGKRPKKQLPPVKRVFLSTNVYKYQGRASIRHDEVSSPEIIFHFYNGRLVPGHVYDR